MPNPKFNRKMRERSAMALPLAFRRPEDPLLGAAMFSALIHDGTAAMDEGLLHGRSDIEKGIKWKARPEDIPEAIHYHVAWLAVRGAGPEARYVGCTISEFWIDRPRRLGAKDLPAQVNAMSRALAGQVEIDMLGPRERKALRELLRDRAASAWDNAGEAFRAAFGEE